LPAHGQQQDNSNQASEVYLSFQYRGVVSNYVTTYYKDQQFYLPVSELFNLLKIQHEVDQGSLSISGAYLGETNYLFDFNNQVARAGDTEIQLQASDFIIKEIDYFVKPAVLEKLFGLKFTTDFNNLTLDLQTEEKMPVVAQYEREQKRQRLNRDQKIYDRSYYPLQYDRNYSVLDGAFLDYNLSAVYTQNAQLFTFSNAVGAEVLAGDVQGNIFGSVNNQQSTFTTTGLRYRYVQRNSNLFSSAIAGQTNSEGISSRSITGVKISNKPVEPRMLFDRFPIEGTVPAQSEVELYLNNRLVDYQQADQSGNYRFLVPLTYGSTDYSVRIYTPSGRAIERNSRIQIPFDYVPPGEIDYTLSGGRLQNPILGSTERGYMGEASITAGLTNWLTAQASSEYLTEYHTSMPAFTGTLNARLFSNYLLSLSANSEEFYSLSSSVVYSNGASWNISYDYNPGNSRLYNVGGSEHRGRINLFTPFQIGNVPLNLRLSSTYQQETTTKLLRYRADLNTRLGRMNIRFGYQDQQVAPLNFETTAGSRLTNSYTYSMPRFNNIPAVLRGMFLRGQVTYLPGLDLFEEMEFQLSQELLQTGRIQLTYGHNFLGGFNTLSLNVTVDFNAIRSNTTTRSTGSSYSITQNVRGSIGYDSYGDQLLFNNRQQVGQSGAAVRLFVDKNNDGSYQDSTDEVITDSAVRLNRAGGKTNMKNGISYISQLLPYYRYDIEINKGAISNPLLVPDVENFSIVTDPNQFKEIEIPFYQSGVISGKVERLQDDSTRKALSGVRLYLESNYEESSKREAFSKEMRTFSDGSFYTYEIPPGKYELFIDPSQLEFLGGRAKPDTMDVTVEAKAQGDFIEGLNFTVIPKPDTTSTKESITASREDTTTADSETEQKTAPDDIRTDSELYYEIQLASFQTQRKAKKVALTAAKHLGGSFSVVKNTNNGLYAIRSAPVPSKDKAIESIISYHNSSYKSAALVVIKNKQKSTVSAPGKFIQIGAYSTKKRAQQFANESAKQLNQEVAITYNSNLDLYRVYLNESFESDQNRQSQLITIKNLMKFRDAYINDRNHIQIAAFEKKQNAYAAAEYAKKILRKKIGIYHDVQKDIYQIYVDENFQSSSALQNALAQVKNASSPFADAFISDIKAEADTQRTHQRPMDFTFQIEIKGVTEETEQAFLSSLSDGDAETDLNRPREDTIIFDNVSTWSQAEDFQQKLSKISTVGPPIIILIEND
jgi:hypothetical protein